MAHQTQLISVQLNGVVDTVPKMKNAMEKDCVLKISASVTATGYAPIVNLD